MQSHHCDTTLADRHPVGAGAFIYVGGYEIVHGEFTSNCTNKHSSQLFRVLQYAVMFSGGLLVALLQLVHGS